jgi:hypothetical protein
MGLQASTQPSPYSTPLPLACLLSTLAWPLSLCAFRLPSGGRGTKLEGGILLVPAESAESP